MRKCFHKVEKKTNVQQKRNYEKEEKFRNAKFKQLESMEREIKKIKKEIHQ